MTHKVHLTESAIHDVIEIYTYILESDGPERARSVRDRIKSAIATLAEFPKRRNHPLELRRIGERSYREIHARLYRIMYQIVDESVYVHAILDSRRDIDALVTDRFFNCVK